MSFSARMRTGGGDEGRQWLDTDKHSRTGRWRGCCRRRAQRWRLWREDAQSRPALGRAWTAGARLEGVIATAAMNEAGKSAWCREHGVYPACRRATGTTSPR